MRRRRTMTVVAAAVIVGSTACTTGHGPQRPAAQPSSSPASTSPASPPPIQPVTVVLPKIEAFVEKERGLRFKHPVKVSLLSPKKFVAKLRSLRNNSPAGDEERLKATLAALGLVSPTVNLTKAFGAATDAGTLGLYSPKTKQLYVRGTAATPGVQAVLAHELTHALTDQWFGLHRPSIEKDTQERDLAFTTLIEGDAERTRMAFEAQLPAAQKQQAEREENSGGTPNVPRIVLELLGLPYIVGPTFVDALILHGGIPALNDAYRHPPVSSEQVLDPARYFARDQPRNVAAPRADGHVVDRSDLGMIGLLLTLEPHLDPATTRQAVDGWGGDQYVTWRAGHNRWCLRDTLVMDDGDATTDVGAALQQWVTASDGRARIERQGQVTTFRSCSS